MLCEHLKIETYRGNSHKNPFLSNFHSLPEMEMFSCVSFQFFFYACIYLQLYTFKRLHWTRWCNPCCPAPFGMSWRSFQTRMVRLPWESQLLPGCGATGTTIRNTLRSEFQQQYVPFSCLLPSNIFLSAMFNSSALTSQSFDSGVNPSVSLWFFHNPEPWAIKDSSGVGYYRTRRDKPSPIFFTLYF